MSLIRFTPGLQSMVHPRVPVKPPPHRAQGEGDPPGAATAPQASIPGWPAAFTHRTPQFTSPTFTPLPPHQNQSPWKYTQQELQPEAPPLTHCLMLGEHPPSTPLDSSSRWEELGEAKEKALRQRAGELRSFSQSQSASRGESGRRRCANTENKSGLLQIYGTIKHISLATLQVPIVNIWDSKHTILLCCCIVTSVSPTFPQLEALRQPQGWFNHSGKCNGDTGHPSWVSPTPQHTALECPLTQAAASSSAQPHRLHPELCHHSCSSAEGPITKG